MASFLLCCHCPVVQASLKAFVFVQLSHIYTKWLCVSHILHFPIIASPHHKHLKKELETQQDRA